MELTFQTANITSVRWCSLWQVDMEMKPFPDGEKVFSKWTKAGKLTVCLEEQEGVWLGSPKSSTRDVNRGVIQRAWNSGCGISISNYCNLWFSSWHERDPGRDWEEKYSVQFPRVKLVFKSTEPISG